MKRNLIARILFFLAISMSLIAGGQASNAGAQRNMVFILADEIGCGISPPRVTLLP